MTKERRIQRIGEFIQRQLTRRQATEQPTVIVLRHCHGEHAGQRLDSMRLSDINSASLAKTADDLYAIAEDDVLGFGEGQQRYVILSFSDDMEPIGRCFFDVFSPVPQEQTVTVGT